jgi:hypothetical protein
MTNRTRIISYDNRVRFFWTMVTVSILSLFIYVYAVNTTTRNIVTRQALERQVANTSANLNSLEFAYIELKNSVTMELAYFHGFKEVKNPLYVSRTNRASLSYNTLRR